MKVAIKDTDIPSATDRYLKERYYYVVDDAYDFGGNAATDVTDVESLEIMVAVGRMSYPDFRMALAAHVTAVGFGALTTDEQKCVSRHYAASKADRDTVHTTEEQETHLRDSLDRLSAADREKFAAEEASARKDEEPAAIDAVQTDLGNGALVTKDPSGKRWLLEVDTVGVINPREI